MLGCSNDLRGGVGVDEPGSVEEAEAEFLEQQPPHRELKLFLGHEASLGGIQQHRHIVLAAELVDTCLEQFRDPLGARQVLNPQARAGK